MKDASTIDWAALRAPFNPNEVDFRVQSNLNNGSAIVLAYMDARLVQNRLDEVVGPENWSFDWTPVGTKGDTITAAKGTLTICGISKSDVGDAGQTEPTKSTVSDAFKRAAVMWGIGRYLYDLGTTFCKVDQKGKIPEAELRQLRANLPKPNGYKAPSSAPEATPQRSDVPTSQEVPASPEMCQALVELAAELGRATHKVPANLTDSAARALGKQWQAEKAQKKAQAVAS